MKLNSENTMPSTCPVRKDCTLEWSPMRWSRSPMSLVSKNDIGSLSSLMKKSLTSEMLIRMDMWSKSQRRMKSVAVRPATIISSPKSMSHIRRMSLWAMPLSTIHWVRKGIISCSTQPRSSPAAIWAKYLRYSKIYPHKKRQERGAHSSSAPARNPSPGSKNMAMPFSSPPDEVESQCLANSPRL